VLRLRELDRSVPCQDFSRLDGAGAGAATIRARLGRVHRSSLFPGDLLAQAASDLSTGFIGKALDGGEVELLRRAVFAVQVVRQPGEKLLDLGILKKTG
jgi:hypothetical protein